MKIDGLKDRAGKPLYEGHRNRLRTRLEREGWNALKPYEMVEVVLCHAMPRQDLSAVSRLLVDRFGSVGGVFADECGNQAKVLVVESRVGKSACLPGRGLTALAAPGADGN